MFEFFNRWPILLHAAITGAGLICFGAIKNRLDVLYAASKHPVDYATGQTTFDGATIKSYYEVMETAGTLDIYVQTQRFDYLFMLAIAVLGICLGTLIGRLARPKSLGRKLGYAAAWSAILGASFDALENAVSFVMLANPDGFADWLALLYSGFAVTKFAFITLAMLACLLAMLAAGLGRLAKRPSLG